MYMGGLCVLLSCMVLRLRSENAVARGGRTRKTTEVCGKRHHSEDKNYVLEGLEGV